MKRLILAGSAALAAFLAAAVLASAAAADRPVAHFRLDNNFTFIGPFISARCGFDVTVTESGTEDVTLFYDESGNIVREIDAFPGNQVTFSAPTGRSVTYTIASVHFSTDYPEGAFLDAPAIVTATGDLSHFPGFFLSAGVHVTSQTVIDFIEPEHIPLTFGLEELESHGNPESQGANMDEICSAISGP